MNRLFLLLFGMVTFVAHAQVPDYVPTDGLVGWWPLDGNAIDDSSFENDGTLHGAMATTNRYDEESHAVNFDGIDDYIDIPDAPSLQITGDITISIWYLTSGPTGNYQTFLTKRSGGQWPYSFGLSHYFGSGGCAGELDKYITGRRNNPNEYDLRVTEKTYAENMWTHAAMTIENDVVSFYENGLEINTACFGNEFSVSPVDQAAPLTLGTCNCGLPEMMAGSLDDLGIWNRALTEEEILALYNAPAPAPGCTDSAACNYNDEANEDDGSCTYPPFGLADCEAGGALCGEGTIWDASQQACVGFNDCPSDLDGDGLIGVEDLLSLLSDFGTDCVASDDPETAEWTCGDPVSYHGYDYATVQIGEQCWFAENLRSEQYANGDSIPGGVTDDEWTSTMEGAQSVFGEGSSEVFNGSSDEAANLATYGRLYNWHAVDDSRGVCPSGWHAPTDGEFMTLEITLGMSESEVNLANFRGTDQGTQMKSSPEDSPSWDGTNTSGFSALASGHRHHFSHYNHQGSFGTFWSSTAFSNINRSWVRELQSGGFGVWRGYSSNQYGFSVRCLKDSE